MEFDNIKQLTTEETNGCTTVDGGESNIIFCMHCGAAVKKGSAYCSNCGQVIPEVKPLETIQDELVPKKKGIKKWPFFVFGPISMMITLVIVLILILSKGSIYDSRLIGEWSLDSISQDGDISNGYGLVTAVFEENHSGYLMFKGDQMELEWEYSENGEDFIFFEVNIEGADKNLAGISHESGLLYIIVDEEDTWIFEKD